MGKYLMDARIARASLPMSDDVNRRRVDQARARVLPVLMLCDPGDLAIVLDAHYQRRNDIIEDIDTQPEARAAILRSMRVVASVFNASTASGLKSTLESGVASMWDAIYALQGVSERNLPAWLVGSLEWGMSNISALDELNEDAYGKLNTAEAANLIKAIRLWLRAGSPPTSNSTTANAQLSELESGLEEFADGSFTNGVPKTVLDVLE